jgi:hypothetical protein
MCSSEGGPSSLQTLGYGEGLRGSIAYACYCLLVSSHLSSSRGDYGCLSFFLGLFVSAINLSLSLTPKS